MEYVGNRVFRHLWRTSKMRHMDVAMKNAMASSLLLSTTPFDVNSATTPITAYLRVALPAGDRGKSEGSSLVSLCIRDANFTHAFLIVIHAQNDLQSHQQHCW